jgi:deoxyribose-phosphate aldolase
MISPSGIARYIDHTLLAATATAEEIEGLSREANEHGFATVCVNPYFVPLASELLRTSATAVCTVIGFPLGCTTTAAKVCETQKAIDDGASEVDMVMNLSALKSGRFDNVERDIRAVVEVAGNRACVKVILEICYLSDAEIRQACQLAMKAGANFVKTSSGFGSGGATVEAVKIMKSVVGDNMGVKASGGIRDFRTAKAMIEAGATRLGTRSGLSIVSAE